MDYPVRALNNELNLIIVPNNKNEKIANTQIRCYGIEKGTRKWISKVLITFGIILISGTALFFYSNKVRTTIENFNRK